MTLGRSINHPIVIGFWNGDPPFGPSAGGIASYILYRAYILGKKGFEVWWLNERQCARFDSDIKSWVEHRTFRLSGLLKKLYNRVPLIYPTVQFLKKERNLMLLEIPHGFLGILPNWSKRAVKIILHCHTSPLVRAFLNKDHEGEGGI
ncbi:MAG: hypothetical protein N2513_03005 [Deltaproteobacteria bacterium]|nr:hypothetical protein [Deltaproteobacteria bacterium]